jgi:transposase-like protein
METVVQEQDSRREGLPLRVQEALGELAGAAQEGLLALSVGVGLGVLSEMMEAELDEVVGVKHATIAGRSAVRHGHEDGEVTLGGRRVAVKRPRARTADGEHEVALATYAYFADRDPLTRVVLEQMLAGVSTRRFARTREPVGQDVAARERSSSKSAVSREFVSRTGEHLAALMARSLSDVRLAALMLDGIELKGRCCVVALGVSTEGVKMRSGSGMAPQRTRPSRCTCSPTSSPAALTSSRVSWSSLTAQRRCGQRSMRSSGRYRCSAVFAIRSATCSTISQNATGRP